MASYCQRCRKEFGLMGKKCNCKVCGLALCKSCAFHELLIYISDDSNRNIQEPEIAIIKVIGVSSSLTLLYWERPKLHRVLAILSAIGLTRIKVSVRNFVL